jgi:hypothetical protein
VPGTAVSRSSVRDYVRRAHAATERACASPSSCRELVTIGGRGVALQFSSASVRDAFFPAFALISGPEAQTPTLTICFWDTASTGIEMPPPTWPIDDYAQRGEVRSFEGTGVRVAFSVDGPTLEFWDATTAVAFVWVRDAASVPSHERAAPARRLLSWWLEEQEQVMVHAAAAGVDGACVLMGGKGGSGKSNTALLCRAAGMQHLADDYCVLETSRMVAYRLYGVAKVWPTDVPRAGRAIAGARAMASRRGEKQIFALDAGDHVVGHTGGWSIAAFVLPRVRLEAPTSMEPASAAETSRAIAVSTIAQQAYAGAKIMAEIARAVRQRPSYRLNLGPDATDHAPALIRALTRTVES